jgi:colanic acid biosynthesis glycosyl transferase WcaI
MKIIIYGINYSPELTGIGKYTGEMAEWLSGRGHTVHVITGKPYYPEWKIHEGYSGKFWSVEMLNGVKVIRCPLYVPKKVTPLKRIIHEFSFLASIFPIWFKTFFHKKYDLVISISPPFHLSFMPLLYTKLKGSKLLTHVQDLQVDAAKSLILIKNKTILNLMFDFERFILLNSHNVSTISPGMKDRIRIKNIPEERIFLFPNSVDTAFIRPLTIEQSLRSELGIDNHVRVILYSGNLGEKQGLEIIVEIADHFKAKKDILFMIVGEGAFKSSLEDIARKKHLQNIKFFPLAPYLKLPALLATADIHLVLQKKSAADLVMPSKLSSILAAGGCAIVSAVQGTYLHDLLEKNKIGILVEPECPGSLIESLNKALENDLNPYRQKAREYALNNLSHNSVMAEFENRLFNMQTINKMQKIIFKQQA